MISLTLLLALVLDRLMGEAQRWHPLVGFGILATWVEHKLYPGSDAKPWKYLLCGWVAVLILIIPFIILAGSLPLNSTLSFISSSLILYWAIGAQSLQQHARAVSDALLKGNISEARLKTAKLVSRDTANMQADDMSRATVESVLENGNDAIFAVIFWFLLAGIPGVIIFRLINTLDAMWGYKTTHYRYFGTAAARLDDVLNFIPARLTALSYALAGHFVPAMRCWFRQGRRWESPNAGPVMAAGAGALTIQLGGNAQYHGVNRLRCILGEGQTARLEDISRAIQLVNRSLVLWLGVVTGVEYFA